MKRNLIGISGTVAAVALTIALLNPAAFAQQKKKYYDPREYAHAKVERIEKQRIHEKASILTEIKVHLLVLDGVNAGKKFISVYRGENTIPPDMFYEEGSTVFIGISRSHEADAVEYVSIYSVDNTFGILVLADSSSHPLLP